MAVTAFCPAHLTGIFTIGEGDAAGAGFSIDRKMVTSVSERNEGGTRIFIGGKEDAAPVSRAVIRRFTEAGCSPGNLEVRHLPEVPVGYGLGMSAAGALSLALALNGLLGAGFGYSQCVKIAHDSEVECGTGLSGVDAAAIGGFLAQRSVGETPVKMPADGREIHIALFSPMETGEIILSEGWKARVNAAGDAALGEFFGELCWENFVRCSRNFASASGLGQWCAGEMEKNGRASMAMVGKTLFSDAALSLSQQPQQVISAKIHELGAGLV